MRKTKLFLSLSALLLGAMTVNCQNAVVASGGNISNAQGASVGISFGQIAVETNSAQNGAVMFGVQQDFSENKPTNNAIQAIANNAIISVEGKQIMVSNLQGESVSIYDIVGRCFANQSETNGQFSATMPITGVYVVKINEYQQNVVIQ